jgi:hypothetical protein
MMLRSTSSNFVMEVPPIFSTVSMGQISWM